MSNSLANMHLAPVSGEGTPPRFVCKLGQITDGAQVITTCTDRYLCSCNSYERNKILPHIFKAQRLRYRDVHANNYKSISNSMGSSVGLQPAATTPRLAGKVAIITGATQGIGESIARLFTRHGAKVVVVDIQDDLGQSVCEDIGLEKASYVHCDVTQEADVENTVNFTIAKHGKLDIMINNTTILCEAKLSILDNNKSDFDRVIDTNLTGVFLGTKHAARAMIPNRSGSIISVGSVSSAIGGVSPHAYTSSKHVVIGLTRNVAAELGKHGIRVNCVSPYLIPPSVPAEITELYPDIFANIYSNIKGVELQQEDVAQAALFLASDESKYISGHNLAVDGGFTTINPGFGLFAPAKSS